MMMVFDQTINTIYIYANGACAMRLFSSALVLLQITLYFDGDFKPLI